MMLDDITTQYMTLAFDLEQHVEGLVDAYVGPLELRNGRSATPRAPQAICADLAALRRCVRARPDAAAYSVRRKAYLDVQLRAMEAMARKLAGDALSFRDEVRLFFDIEPEHTPEAVFDTAIQDLDAALPGTGPVAERMSAWKQQFEVSPAVARQMINRIAHEAHRRTASLVDLPAGETVEFDLVSDKPWSGYNWYLGQARSRVEVNTDLPIRADVLLDLVCHEAYPGHHTEHALKEQRLYLQRGRGEHAIQLINTPECVISEGIAMLAADVVFGAEAVPWAAAEIYPLAGITADIECQQRVHAATWALRALNSNAALLLHEEQVDRDTVVRYIMRYGLRTEQEARQQLRFVELPLWRAYTFTYHTGRNLLGRWLGHGDRSDRFATLLVEQVYPSLVEQWLLEEDQPCVG